jgi:hypothetical protein
VHTLQNGLTQPEITIHDHCRKHTPTSKFSHYAGTLEDVAKLARANWASRVPGDHDGTVLVRVPAEGFFTSIVKVTDKTNLTTRFAKRDRPAHPDESAFIQNSAVGAPKLPAETVDLVVYLEGKNVGTLVTILAVGKTAPMDPQTMWRNQTDQPGGSPALYTSEQWARSVGFWGQHTLCAPE